MSGDLRVENPVTETFSRDSCLFCIFLKVPCKYIFFYPTALTLTFSETRKPVRQNKRGLTELRRAVRNSPGNRAVCFNRRKSGARSTPKHNLGANPDGKHKLN